MRWFTENELVFRGMLAARDEIYCLELDFNPVIADNTELRFLQDVEVFLKKRDACFFMAYDQYYRVR